MLHPVSERIQLRRSDVIKKKLVSCSASSVPVATKGYIVQYTLEAYSEITPQIELLQKQIAEVLEEL